MAQAISTITHRPTLNVDWLKAFGLPTAAASAIVGAMILAPATNIELPGFGIVVAAGVFIISTIAGANLRSDRVLLLILAALFIEPSIPVTRSLDFQLITNGLVLGGLLTLRRQDFTKRIVLLAAPVVLFALYAGAMPIVVSAPRTQIWFGIYESLMLFRIPVIIIVAWRSNWYGLTQLKTASIALVLALVLAVAGLVESLHIDGYTVWFNDYYLAHQPVDTASLTSYYRIRGTAQPIIFGTSLVMLAIYAFPVLVNHAGDRMKMLTWFSIPLVGAAILGTSSRLALAALAISIVVIWARSERFRFPELRYIAAAAASLMLLVCIYVADSDVRSVYAVTHARTVHFSPTDPSLQHRIDEYGSPTPTSVFGNWETETTGANITSELMRTTDRFGAIGTVIYLSVLLSLFYGFTRNRQHLTAGRATIAVIAVMLLGTRVVTSETIMPAVVLLSAVSYFSGRKSAHDSINN